MGNKGSSNNNLPYEKLPKTTAASVFILASACTSDKIATILKGYN